MGPKKIYPSNRILDISFLCYPKQDNRLTAMNLTFKFKYHYEKPLDFESVVVKAVSYREVGVGHKHDEKTRSVTTLPNASIIPLCHNNNGLITKRARWSTKPTINQPP